MRFRWLLLLQAGLLIILAGCNIFGWASSPTSASDYLNQGRAKLSSGDFSGALSDFRNAVRENPRSSDARFACAKARLLSSGVNSLDILSSLSQFQMSGNNVLIPFFNTSASYWPNARATSLYQALYEVNDMLSPIFLGQTTGSFSPRDVALDYGLCRTVFGMLQMRDNNRDLVIDINDVDLSLIWQDGRFTIEGFAELYRTRGPGAVNGILGDIENYTHDLVGIINNILPDTTTFNSSNLRSTVDSLRRAMGNYRIADGLDNDEDGLPDGAMLGIDTLKFYFGSNRRDIRFIRSNTYNHDAAGSAIDVPRPWTLAWVDTMDRRRPGYIDSLFRMRRLP